jgi:formamidopyrimidine-DNA glycosylase
MPELPEVEVVRRGLQRWVAGRVIGGVDVLNARAIRRHEPGAADFRDRLRDQRIAAVSRRGKYLWFVLDGRDFALVAHLGMSGQFLIESPQSALQNHLRVVIDFHDKGDHLRFVDQRTFGGMAIDHLVPDSGRGLLPASVSHIARDPLDPLFDDRRFVSALRSRRTGVKRALLDQTLMSGVGNIYADEALWRARIHPERPCSALAGSQARDLLGHAREVMGEALERGGTSFDSLYVNVNGQSGWFERSLNAYGRQGQPCSRCGRLIVREAFMNRSSYRCPGCQRAPRRGGTHVGGGPLTISR